jgi:hypothetical protein
MFPVGLQGSPHRPELLGFTTSSVVVSTGTVLPHATSVLHATNIRRARAPANVLELFFMVRASAGKRLAREMCSPVCTEQRYPVSPKSYGMVSEGVPTQRFPRSVLEGLETSGGRGLGEGGRGELQEVTTASRRS